MALICDSRLCGNTNDRIFQCAGDNSNRANCLGHDPAGNVTANGTASYSYDSENHLAAAGGMNYAYDAGGERIKKSNSSTGTLYWYGAQGVRAESDLSGIIQHEYGKNRGQEAVKK